MAIDLDEVGRLVEPRPRRGREGRRRQARRARAADARAARRRPRPDRGLPRAREDADGALVRARDLARLLAHPVHARPDAVRRDRLVDLQPARSPTSSSGPGPIFANLLLADEINRAPPKTQAALLEAMQERQVTSEGETRPLGPPFLVLATQNPIEYEGHLPAARGAARPLPAADVGRLPEPRRRVADARRAAPSAARTRSSSSRSSIARRCSRCRPPAKRVHVSEPVGLYMVDVVAATREAQSIQVGASPRGSLALLKLVPLPRGAARARLRDARRRQVRRRAGARAPADAPARAVGAARLGRGRRARAARPVPTPVGRRPRTARTVTRYATPKLAAYAASRRSACSRRSSSPARSSSR